MKPNSTLYNGRTYYFSVVLKEMHSDYMMNIYYMTIKMSGDPVDEADLMANATQIVISIPSLDMFSNGVLAFSVPVNTSLILDNFDNIFSVYVNDTL